MRWLAEETVKAWQSNVALSQRINDTYEVVGTKVGTSIRIRIPQRFVVIP